MIASYFCRVAEMEESVYNNDGAFSKEKIINLKREDEYEQNR